VVERGGGAIGILETRGVVALAAGIEAVAVRGSLAAVRQAVNAGSAAVEQYGELRAAQIYPKPHGVSVGLLENGSADRLARAIESPRASQ